MLTVSTRINILYFILYFLFLRGGYVVGGPGKVPKNRMKQYLADTYFGGKDQSELMDAAETGQLKDILERMDKVLDHKAPMMMEDIIFLRDFVSRTLEERGE